MNSQEYRLEMRGISKQFGGIKALQNVNLKVKAGEIHALVGENGAGKSTLIKILSGAYSKDSGEILVDGKNVNISSTQDAKKLGIAVIYQEFMLVPELTVAENIYIDSLTSSGNHFINWPKLYQMAEKQLDTLGFGSISPKAKVKSLSVAEQQVVEICKNLTRNAKIFVLDEPTAVLTITEIDKLFNLIKGLKAKGVSIIFISHHLNEIFELCDSYTVLKDGKFVDYGLVKNVTNNDLIHKMIGRELTQMFPPRSAKIGEVVLKVENLSAGPKVNNVSFQVHAGEVLGFSGLVGAGRTETMRAIFGADKKDGGTIEFLGKRVDFKDPKDAVSEGLGYLSEDRKQLGLVVNQSICINTTLASIKRVSSKGVLQLRQENKLVTSLLSELSAKYRKISDNVNSLSGGNQQKISFAKWVFANCKCLILDEPTRGVDVGARVEIYNIINSLSEKGVAVIIVSSEMTEIIGMCDRAVVMAHGQITGELNKNDLSESSIIQYAMKEE